MGGASGTGAATSSMRREASVEDLFAPLWRLDVQSSSSRNPRSGSTGSRSSRPALWTASSSTSSPAVTNVTSRVARPGSPIRIPIPSSNGSGAGLRTEDTAAAGATAVTAHSWPSSNCSATTEADIEAELPAHSSSYSAPTVHAAVGNVEIKPQVSGDKQHMQSNNSATADLLLSNSASDDEQVAVDERKQRRMLSNRESARRSRLRKQQHLDELRAQVAHLRGENNQIISKYSVATQHYAQISEENRVLRSHAMDLSRQLQRLHHTAAAQHPGGFLAIGLERESDCVDSDIA